MSAFKNLYIKTYGCQMNVYDSDMIVKSLEKFMYQVTDNIESADLVILNTCHIREKAAEKVYSELGKINALQKKLDKKITTVVAGCVAQAEGEEIFKRAKNVDVIVGPQSLHSLPELIMKVERQQGNQIKLNFESIEKFDYLKGELNHSVKSDKISAFLSIQEGCDKFCTFCVVPYTRGAEFSRPVQDIIQEAVNLVNNGAKEIILLGQNVNAYHGVENESEVSLGKLINHIAQIDGVERIRYTTSHPMDMHEDLYIAHVNEEKLMPHLHLPVQSGSDKILKRMNRKYTSVKYLEIINRLKISCREIAFSSDFIVGFPGETDDDFQQTLDLVEKVGYAQSYSFKYSPRPGTPGAEYKQVDDQVKSIRLQKLQDILQKQQLDFNQNTIGKTIPVLFDRKNGNQVIGRTPYMQTVYLDDRNLFGKVQNIKITEGLQNILKGEITE